MMFRPKKNWNEILSMSIAFKKRFDFEDGVEAQTFYNLQACHASRPPTYLKLRLKLKYTHFMFAEQHRSNIIDRI
jgi:hypothetical protein